MVTIYLLATINYCIGQRLLTFKNELRTQFFFDFLSGINCFLPVAMYIEKLTDKMLHLIMSEVVPYPLSSPVTCHLSPVTCHLSHVMWLMEIS